MERFRQKKSKIRAVTEGIRKIQRQRSPTKFASESSSYNGVTTNGDLVTCESGRSSSRQVTGTPIKKLLAEEMSKETESKRRPPSVIARLMGFDGLPSQQPLSRQHKGFLETYQEGTASLASQRDGKPYKCQLNRKKSMEEEEFKDVYEVSETSKVERSRCVAKGTVNSKLSEAEMAFVRQKFMDAKRLSTDEKFHNSKEFCDTLEMLDNNKDILMKFLEQPDFLFTKHLLDLQSTTSRSHCSRIAVVNPSNSEKYEGNTVRLKLGKKTLGNDNSSTRKHRDSLSMHSYNHPGARQRPKSSNFQLEVKPETVILPTRIVVLKPNLEKVRSTTKSISSPGSSHGHLSDYRTHVEYHSSRFNETGPRVKTNMSRESREKAKEITRRMRESFHSKPIDTSSIFKGYAGDESSYYVSGSDSGNESDVTMLTSRKSFASSNHGKPSSSCSHESSVCSEAKKRLSKRWKMSQRYYQDVGAVGKGSTLGEMLAISDGEIRPQNFDPMIDLEGSTDRFGSNDDTAEWDSPSGISSRDGWKDECFRNCSRSRSVPAYYVGCSGPKSSMQYGILDQDSHLISGETMNQGRNKAIKDNFHMKEDYSSRSLRAGNKKSRSSCLTCNDGTDSLGEKQFSQSQMEINLEKKDQSEQKSLVAEMPAGSVNGKSLIADAKVDVVSEDMVMCSESSDELPQMPSTCLIENSNSSTLGPDDSKTQEPQIGPSEEDMVLMQCPVPEPQSPSSSKEADHPSPVSVLEVPFSEDVSSGYECFEQVNADLHELRMQLKLLKMESGGFSEGEILASSDTDVGPGFLAASEENGIFKYESWESSYLADVLAGSGFNDANPSTIISAWHSPDCPLDPWLFDNLEKKYCNEKTWSRSERRLLFDRINSGLFEIFQRYKDPNPRTILKVGPNWHRYGGLDYELHKLLTGEEKTATNEDMTKRMLDREMEWLDFGDEIGGIGRELEKLLIDDLIAEVANM